MTFMTGFVGQGQKLNKYSIMTTTMFSAALLLYFFYIYRRKAASDTQVDQSSIF